MIVKTASRSDLREILSLQREAYLTEAEIYNDYNIPPLHQTDAEIEDEFNRGLFLKIEFEGLIIGSVRAYEENSVCHIGKLIVKDDHQNRGLGTMLLEQIESRFPNAKVYELFTGANSRKNLHLYRKNGYLVSHSQEITSVLTMVFLKKRTLLTLIDSST